MLDICDTKIWRKNRMNDMTKKCYQLASDLKICRIVNGMWQVAGGHGYIDEKSAIGEMTSYHDAGLTTWDMADIYGPAEEFFGQFRHKMEKTGSLSGLVGLTKFVPNPG